MRDKYKATETPFLSGFKNSAKDGTSCRMNFFLSNGDRSTQRDEYWPTNYTHMIPADALNKIRRITIHYGNNYIAGFSFFDKDGALLWKIGATTDSGLEKETVVLAENEVIVGVVAKLEQGCQSVYTDL